MNRKLYKSKDHCYMRKMNTENEKTRNYLPRKTQRAKLGN